MCRGETMEEIAQNIEDVEETTQDEQEQPVSLERDSLMDSIAQQVRAQREEQVEETAIAPDEEEVIEEPATVDLKVDGEIITKPKEEVEAEGGSTAYQMKLAADKRFKEAAEAKAKAEQLRLELEERERQLLQRQVELETLQPTEISDEEVDEFISTVYSGDEEKARDAFKNVLSKVKVTAPTQPANTLDEDSIAERALFKLDQKKGLELFQKNYSHLNADPRLKSMTNEATIRIMKEEPDLMPSEVIIKAAKEIDEWFGHKPQKQEMEEQIAHKESIKNIKTANKRVKQVDSYKPKTQEEIFAELQAGRSR